MSITNDLNDLTGIVMKQGWDNIARDAVIRALCFMMKDVLGDAYKEDVERRLTGYAAMDSDDPESRDKLVAKMRYLMTGEDE